MAKLETEVNQIYLTHPENKKTSLLLYEEAIMSALHLFVLAELKDLTRKSETAELKKISEIILRSFRANKKMAAEALFEAALAQINQNLADLAHEGRKSWVGKFSCLITLKSGDNIFVANNGQTAAWLKRRNELLEILPAEKRGIHPLKTFVNFTQGKVLESDGLIMTTANIFNFISFELFAKILNHNDLARASEEISRILKDSMTQDLAFCAFLLGFAKKTDLPTAETVVPIYAPLPEEIELGNQSDRFQFPFPANFTLPRISFPQFKFKFFQSLSRSGKFFFLSFTIFALLFATNLAVYGFRTQAKKTAQRIDLLVDQINKELNDAQSSLIYKNDEQALQLMQKAQTDFDRLKQLNNARASELAQKVEDIKNQVNKVSFVTDPKVYIELKHHPTYLAKSPNGFLLGNQDSNSLSSYTSSLNDYFLLNSLKFPIVGLAYFAPAGIVVATNNKLYRINSNLKQLEPIVEFLDNDIDRIKNISGNLYVHDKKNNQIIKVNFAKNKYSVAGLAATKSDLRDFGLDKDVYVLYPDSLNKIISGQTQAFKLPTLTDGISNGTKIAVASNLYILEATKKRLIILNKNGVLQNQIYFPNTTTLLDFYADEPGRNIYILDDNKLLKLTF